MTNMLKLYIFNAIGSIVMFGILLLLAFYTDRKKQTPKANVLDTDPK